MIRKTTLDDAVTTLLIGVDSMLGGDILHKSGLYHEIGDSWFSDESVPDIYHDSLAVISRNYFRNSSNGYPIFENPIILNYFIQKYKLHLLSSNIKNSLNTILDEDDRINVLNLNSSLNVMLRTIMSEVLYTDKPSYDEKYLLAIANVVSEVKVFDPKDARDNLRKALSETGFDVSNSRDLKETFKAWKSKVGNLPATDVKLRANEMVEQLLSYMRSQVFSQIDFGMSGYKKDLSDVAFSGHSFATVQNVDFTGSSIYRGGFKEKPLLKGLFEYNIDHPISEVELLHLCAHEVIGHYLNSAITDLLYRDGKLNFLSTVSTMCTPETVFQEGLAQNMFELIFGSRENASEVFGKDLLVSLAYSDLQDVAKHNVSILYQRDGKSIEEVKRHIAEDCLLEDYFVDKLSGSWAKDKIMGPMYGPAYFIGKQIVNDAIRTHGNVPVAKVSYKVDGEIDIKTFQNKISRLQ